MKKKTPCFEITDPSQVGFPVRLYQASESRGGKFSVLYGSEMHDELEYGEAARQFGLCLFHALACVGRIDNGRP